MDSFSIGIDTRTKKQKKDAKRQMKRKKQKQTSKKPTQFTKQNHPLHKLFMSYNFFQPKEFTLIPDAEYEFQIVFHCIPTLAQKHETFLNLIYYKKKEGFTAEQSKHDYECTRYSELFRTYEKRKWAFRRLLNCWLQKRAATRPLNTEDPFTLAEPKQPIRAYDMSKRGFYQYDARSLQRHFHTALSYNDWEFPSPLPLKNPFTNLPFSLAQMIEIVKQLRHANATSWLIEAHMEFLFQKQLFQQIFNAPFVYCAILDRVRNPTSEQASELIYEFIEEQFDDYMTEQQKENEPIESRLKYVKWALTNRPDNEYIQKWIALYQRSRTLELLETCGYPNDTEDSRINVASQNLVRDKHGLHTTFLFWNWSIVKKYLNK